MPERGWARGGGGEGGVAIDPVSSQGWIANPTDQSTLIQASIDSLFEAGGGELKLPPGVFYGSFKMRPAVDLKGSGWQTVLRAMPGQTAPVVDYSAYNAYHTVLRDLRVDGNYIYGRTDGVAQGNCAGIWMDTTPPARTGFMFANPSAAPASSVLPGGDGFTYSALPGWNDAANMIERVFVTACGGSHGIYIGTNQNGTVVHDTFIYMCANTAMQVQCSDSFFSNVSAGACGLGIYITNTNNRFVGCKSWYHGVNTGYTGQGHGYLVIMPDATTYGGLQIIGCESQDNAGDGLNLNVVNGATVKGFISGGDSHSALNLWNAQSCDIDFTIVYADRAQDTVGIYFASDTPKNNRIKWSMIGDLPGLGTFQPYVYGTAGTTYSGWGNTVEGPQGMSVPLVQSAAGNTLTPTNNKTVVYAAYTGPLTIAAPAFAIPNCLHGGEEIIIVMCDTTGGNPVTWGGVYHGAPSFTTVAYRWSTFRFIYLGNGFYACMSSTLNMA